MLQTKTHKFWIDSKGVLWKVNEMYSEEKGLPPAVFSKSLWDEVLKILYNSPTSDHRKFEKLY